MKKIFKNLFLISIVLFSVAFISGCSNINSKIIGTWEYKDDGLDTVYVFNKDKTGFQTITTGEDSSTNKFTYETKKDKILITFENDTDVFEYGYRFDNNDLVLKDTFGDEFTCKKK